MSKDWVKSKEAELVTQAQDMAGAISGDPVQFGSAPADATALSGDVTGYVDAYHLAKDPATRTPLTIEEKDVKKAAVTARMRSIGGRVRSNPAVSNAVKMSIGLHIKDASPSPVSPPATAPVLTVLSVSGRTVRVRIADELTPSLRAKPHGVSEYEVFTHVGESAPADAPLWTYQGQGTRNVFEVTLPNSVASGAKVWLCARWCNRRGQAGRTSGPVAVIVVGTVAEEESKDEGGRMRDERVRSVRRTRSKKFPRPSSFAFRRCPRARRLSHPSSFILRLPCSPSPSCSRASAATGAREKLRPRTRRRRRRRLR